MKNCKKNSLTGRHCSDVCLVYFLSFIALHKMFVPNELNNCNLLLSTNGMMMKIIETVPFKIRVFTVVENLETDFLSRLIGFSKLLEV